MIKYILNFYRTELDVWQGWRDLAVRIAITLFSIFGLYLLWGVK